MTGTIHHLSTEMHILCFPVINSEHLEPFPPETSNNAHGMEAWSTSVESTVWKGLGKRALCKGASETRTEKLREMKYDQIGIVEALSEISQQMLLPTPQNLRGKLGKLRCNQSPICLGILHPASNRTQDSRLGLISSDISNVGWLHHGYNQNERATSLAWLQYHSWLAEPIWKKASVESQFTDS